MTAPATHSGSQIVADRRPTAIPASQLGIDRETMINTLIATIMPNATNEEVAAFCIVSSKYGPNPFTKKIYAYPKKGGGIQAVIGIDGWVTLINRQENLDGVEFDERVGDGGAPISTACRIYVKGRSRPVTITEWFDECVRPSELWKTMPRRMLRHKALIQTARVAFGLNGIADEDEGREFAVVLSGPLVDRDRQPAPRQILPDTQLSEADAEKKLAEAAAYTRSLEQSRKTGADDAKLETPAPESQTDPEAAEKEKHDQRMIALLEVAEDDPKYRNIILNGVAKVALAKRVTGQPWKLDDEAWKSIVESVREGRGHFANPAKE